MAVSRPARADDDVAGKQIKRTILCRSNTRLSS
jgi:hypothetical protein